MSQANKSRHLLCVGIPNVDVAITNDSPILHWNGAGAPLTKGGMAWNVATHVVHLGGSASVYGPHGDDFLRATNSISNVVIVPHCGPDFRDNLCLELFGLGEDSYTVYLPLHPETLGFVTITDVIRASADALGTTLNRENTLLYVAVTQPPYEMLDLPRRPDGFELVVSLSHVIKYWTPDVSREVLQIANLLIMNDTEFDLLQDHCGPASLDWFSGELRLLVITKGPNGVDVLQRNGRTTYELPFKPVSSRGVFAEGDAFAGGLLFSYLEGKDIESCVLAGQRNALHHMLKNQRPACIV